MKQTLLALTTLKQRHDEALELLGEAKLQFEYLNEKFGETGTSNAVIAKI